VDTGSFPRSAAAIPRIGPAPELMAAAFAMGRPGPVPGPFRAGDSFVVAEVTVREIADDASWLAKKAALREEALRQRQAEVQESYVAALKKSATIVKNDELLAPAPAEG
jgi:peptidyl-prolyl cis-trans isomerase D